MYPCLQCWRTPSSGTCGTDLLWHKFECKMSPMCLTHHSSQPQERRTFLMPSRSICMLSSRGFYKQTMEKHSWGLMSQPLMLRKFSMTYVKMHSGLPALQSTIQGSSPTLLLWGLAMAIGMEPPIASSSIGRSRSSCTISGWFIHPFQPQTEDAYATECSSSHGQVETSQESSWPTPSIPW